MNWNLAWKAGAIVFLLVLATLVVAAAYSPPRDDLLPGYRAHDPIRINGDADFTLENGVVGGAGTPEEPFIIAGWHLTGHIGIWVGNTTKSFTIRDVRVERLTSSGYSEYGIYLKNLSNCLIEDCYIRSAFSGIQIDDYSGGFSRDISIVNVTLNRCSFGATVNLAVNVSISGCTFSSSQKCGIYANRCDRLEISDSFLAGGGGWWGFGSKAGSVNVSNTTGLLIEDNTVIDYDAPGITIYNSPEARIAGNKMACSDYPVVTVISSPRSCILNNSINGNGGGIEIWSSDSCQVADNCLVTCWMKFCSSGQLVIARNRIIGDGVLMEQIHASDFISNVLDAGEGQESYFTCLTLRESSNVTVSGNSITRSAIGAIVISSCSKIDIVGNLISNNTDQNDLLGVIGVSSSAGVTMRFNSVRNSSNISVRDSSEFVMDGNNISDMSLYVDSYGNISVVNNTFSGTTWISIITYGRERVHGNSFLGSQVNVFDPLYAGIWNESYPIGGNYWGNATGADEFSGPDQDVPGADGILDSPMTIDTDSMDIYPLASPAVRVDTTPPTVVVHLDTNPQMDNWFKNAPEVTIEAADLLSGVQTTMYRVDDDAWRAYSLGFLMDQIGSHTVETYSIDGEGNQCPTSRTVIRYDPYPPEMANLAPEQGAEIHVSWVEISAACSENLSGILYCRFWSGNGYDDGFRLSPNISVTGLRDGESWYEITIVDLAGNYHRDSSYEITVNLGSDNVFSPDGPYGRWFAIAALLDIAAALSTVVLWGKNRIELVESKGR